MKVQIDTINKTIKVEDSINLGQFIEEIKKLLSDWESYRLETNTIISNWIPAITYYPSYPIYPTTPYIYCSSGTCLSVETTATNTILNLELGEISF